MPGRHRVVMLDRKKVASALEVRCPVFGSRVFASFVQLHVFLCIVQLAVLQYRVFLQI